MDYRKVVPDDGLALLSFLCQLDNDAPFMLYRPGERVKSVHDLRSHISHLKYNSAIFAYWDDARIVGYLALYGGRLYRCAHVATLSCGVLAGYRRQGISSTLWHMGKDWAIDNDIKRVELTVVGDNLPAYYMYLKWGFHNIACREKSFHYDTDRYLNEIIMSVVLDG